MMVSPINVYNTKIIFGLTSLPLIIQPEPSKIMLTSAKWWEKSNRKIDEGG